MNTPNTFRTAELTMWRLVQRYTGQVGYRRGVKSEGLSLSPPVIDCSGWTALLLTQAMQAENEAANRALFSPDDMLALHGWSDRMIEQIATRTGFILDGQDITADNLPRCATIGLKMGEPAWANNYPRSRGITHIVQVVCRPEDGARFVSQSFGGSVSPGISLTPLDEWLASTEDSRRAGEMWIVDAFRLASTD
jgi:hypothetical protein